MRTPRLKEEFSLKGNIGDFWDSEHNAGNLTPLTKSPEGVQRIAEEARRRKEEATAKARTE